eukprot:TRINITY_DN6089_c0_g1_i1.p1 TRINITY_DN6089_c0_g1~~TRINITY_DN6089_c0_g1_i1.p1  ORF type:complete len:335 (-),score=49.14 TRINITY_DN6089_c0_g1_i1:143-1123(-)
MEKEPDASIEDVLVVVLQDHLISGDAIGDITASQIKALLESDTPIIPPGHAAHSRQIVNRDVGVHHSILYYQVLRDAIEYETRVEECISIEEVERLYEEITGGWALDQPSPYPKKPFYKEIAKGLARWLKAGKYPNTFTPMDNLNETEDDTIRLSSLTDRVLKLFGKWDDDKRRSDIVREVLKIIGVRGLLTMLNVRKTKGSVDVFPPNLKQILISFNMKHDTKTPGVYLSVGGRALSKHFFRSRDGWWGNGEGKESVKNRKAVEILVRILKNAVWLNVHLLPHNVTIFECRLKEGYGARWTADGTEFRGFLEPQLQLGHEVGWIH